MKNSIIRLLAMTLSLPVIGSALFACSQNGDDSGTNTLENTGTSTLGENAKNNLEVSAFRVIRPENASKELREGIDTLRSVILDCTGISPDVATDKDSETGNNGDLPSCEIIIGRTTRAASSEALDLLWDSWTKNEYFVGYNGKDIVIQGETTDAVMFAMRQFLINYVIPAKGSECFLINEPFSDTGSISSETTVLGNLYTVETTDGNIVESLSTSGVNRNPSYGRVIELKHNKDANGTLLATSQWSGYTIPVYSSTDGGENWSRISEVYESLDPSAVLPPYIYEYPKKGVPEGTLVANWQPEIYELPNAVGDMPEGTILLAGCSHDNADLKTAMTTTKICLWKSSDLGKTWEEISVVDEAGGAEEKNGIYEPYLICDEDGTLVCFYSDETEVHDVGGQRLVFKTSKDGINWSEKKYCVAPTERYLRPGMVSVTKMGDHGYLMVYELLSAKSEGGPVCYKTSDSLTEWDYATVGTKIVSSDRSTSEAHPYCTWTPTGGKNGTVIAAGGADGQDVSKQSKLFLSFDLGKTWCTIDNPLKYDYKVNLTYAYSFGFFTGSDGTIYHICNAFPKDNSQKYKSSDLLFAKIKITGLEY